jgi:hypothetical protein
MATITIEIKRVGDELELEVTEAAGGDPNEGLQIQRRRSASPFDPRPRNRKMKEQKRHRMQHASADAVEDVQSGVHQTIILLDKNNFTDKVVFKSAKPFVVDVEFDPTVQDLDDPEPRRSPFLWDTPQKSQPVGAIHQVEAVFDNSPLMAGGAPIAKTKPTEYQFYKATFWSDGLKLDPDWYCDR